MRHEPFLLPPAYHQRYFCYRRAYCAGAALIPAAWYYVSPYNVPWLLLKPEGRQEARGKCRPQVISGFGPFGHTEPATLGDTLEDFSCTKLPGVAERQWKLLGTASTDRPAGLAELVIRAGPFCFHGYHTSGHKESIKIAEMSFYCALLSGLRDVLPEIRVAET